MSVAAPVWVISQRPLAELPYDLWAQGHRLELSLATLFPHLALPLVRALTLDQRNRLFGSDAPARRLAQRATADYMLQVVFDVDITELRHPARFLLWLNDLHSHLGPLPSHCLSD
jgi:hypothetical protein